MGFLTDIANRVLPASGKAEDRKVESAADQTSEEQSLATFVKRKVEEIRAGASRIAHEGVWMTNIAYVLGFDSVYYDTSMRQYRPVGGPYRWPTRARTHCNLVLPAMQNKLARLCKIPPRYECAPEDSSQKSKEEAHTGLNVLLDLWDKLHINEKRLTTMMWTQQCGHAYMKVCYDEGKGTPIVDPSSGEVLGFEGDIRVDVVSAFEVFADPLAKDLDEARWIIHAKVRKLDYFRDHYPERGHLVKEEGAWLLSLNYEMRINSLNNVGPNTSGVQQQMENSAIELAYYERPNKRYPKGRRIVCANGVLLVDKDELIGGDIPFVKFDDIQVAGKYYSEAAVTHCRPLADQYNRTISRRADWVNKLLAGKYIAAKGHGLSQEALNDASGEVVEFNPVPNAPPPTAMNIPAIPQYAFTEGEMILKDFYAIWGLSEVSRGQLPAAGIPAVGMQLLVEQDETRIGVEVEQHEHSYARLGTLLLKFAGECYKTERPLKMKGIGGEYNISYYDGTSLPKKPDVRVVRGSTIPTSRALNRQEILNAYQQGLLGPPQDPTTMQRVNSMLEFGDSNDIWKKFGIDKAQVARSIALIEKGEMPNIHKLDNHQMHIQELNDFRKSKEDSLSPEQKEIVENCLNTHAEMLSELASPQLAMAKQQMQLGHFADGSDPSSALNEAAQAMGSQATAQATPTAQIMGG